MTDKENNVVGTILKWSSHVDKAFIKVPLSALQELGKGRGCNDMAFYMWLLHLEYKLRNSDKVMGGYLVTWQTLQELCGISRMTLYRRLESLEKKGFISRKETVKTTDGSLAEYNIIVKPCYAEQQLEYIDQLTQEDSHPNTDYDFEHIYVNGTDIVIHENRYNIEQVIHHIIATMGRGTHVMRAYDMLLELGVVNDTDTISESELNDLCYKLGQEIQARQSAMEM